MKLFSVYCRDINASSQLRDEHYPKHRQHLQNAQRYGVTISLSGPLVDEVTQQPIGSLFVFEGPDRQTVESFHQSDPFFECGIWANTEICEFIRKR